MENWQTIAFDSMKGHRRANAIFYVGWIFMGNFILLNLFLAILLDSFLVEDEVEEMSEEKNEEIRLAKERRKELREQERLRKLKKMGASMFRSFNAHMIRQAHMKKKMGMQALVNMA